MKMIVIVGGGVAGLAAALAVKRAAEDGAPVDWLLLEKDDRTGGKLLTELHDGFVVDGGPDCYLAEKPWVGRMAARLGIADRLLPTNDIEKRTFVYSKGRLHLLPDGIMMMVPTKFQPLATTGLFSWRGKARMGLDLFIPKRKGIGDESLASFVVRRLGRECLDRLAEPMVGGIHAADPAKMSLRASFPRFLQMEERHGSLIRGFLAARRNSPPRPGARPAAIQQTYFMSFKGGMGELPVAMSRAAGPERLRVGVEVAAVETQSAGPRYLIRTSEGESIAADAVLVATEAHQAARFLNTIDAKLAGLLAQIPWTSAATVSLAYRTADVRSTVKGFGFLVPAIERRQIMASTSSSTKWLGRAPEGYALLRAFVGGPHNGHLVEQDDASMIEMVRGELREILGLAAEPIFGRVYRWPNAMPQYTIGHLERLALMEQRLEGHPGLHLAGASYRGIGMGDSMNSAEQAIGRALETLLGQTGGRQEPLGSVPRA